MYRDIYCTGLNKDIIRKDFVICLLDSVYITSKIIEGTN